MVCVGDRKWTYDNRRVFMISNDYKHRFKAVNHNNSAGFYCKFNKDILPELRNSLIRRGCIADTLWARDSVQGLKTWQGVI